MCAFYQPPTEITPEFNSLYFQGPNNDSLTTAEADERYLARQNIATSVASATSFSAEVAATSFTSLNSGATIFHLDNLAGNNASLVIRNQRTDHNLFYRQFGTTNSHVFTTNGTGTTNLTLSNTLNTSSLPFLASFAAGGNASRIIEAHDSTSGNRLALIPSTTNGNLGPMTIAGDTQIISLTGAAGNSNLSISTWTNTTCGIRMTGTQVLIGAGGAASLAPTSAITFNTSASNATVTGNLTFTGDIILRTTYVAKTSGMLGYSATFNANQTGALTTGVVFNNITAGFFLNIGVYMFSILVYLNKTVSGGDITLIETGISLLNNSFSGGYIATVAGQQTYAGAGTDAIVHNVTFTLPVQINTTLYFLTRATHTLTNLNNTVNSYIQVTRVG